MERKIDELIAICEHKAEEDLENLNHLQRLNWYLSALEFKQAKLMRANFEQADSEDVLIRIVKDGQED